MNIQELIERMKGFKKNFGNKVEYIELDTAIELISRLDEPQKVTIPQFVGDWIKYCKNTNVTMIRALLVGEVDFYNYANQKDHFRLIYFLGSGINQETFARAWLDGYEVEKEPKYIVKMKGMQKDCVALKKNKDDGYWYLSDTYPYNSTVNFHTRKELEEAGFGWVFDCRGVEVEEVE